MEIQSSIKAGQRRSVPAIHKNQTWAFMENKFRNRCESTIDWRPDWRLECDAANRSHIRVLPILQFRCRETERQEVVHSFLPEPLYPGKIFTRQPLSYRGKLSGVGILFRQHRAHDATASASSHP